MRARGCWLSRLRNIWREKFKRAIQQLKQEKDAEVKALQEENEELRNRLATLEANDEARDKTLAAIEQRLLSADNAALVTVALNEVFDAE